MSQFEPAVQKVLSLEGGRVHDPADLGSTTNFGISLRFLRSINPQASANDIDALTQEQAMEIYRQHFWNGSGIEQIMNQEVANKIFDMVVNLGRVQAVILLQTALQIPENERDGILGPLTAAAANETNSDMLLKIIRLTLIAYYLHLANIQPSQRGFLRGWLNRVFA